MGNLYRFGSYLLDRRKRALSQDGSPIALTPKAFDVLLFLVQNPNRLITKEELFKAVWADSFVEEGNLTQNIFLLRKALAQNSEDSGLILTIPRKGYQFAAEQLLNNRLQIRVSGATQKVGTLTKQTKMGPVRTGQGELANRRLDVSPQRIAQNRLQEFWGPNWSPTCPFSESNLGVK